MRKRQNFSISLKGRETYTFCHLLVRVPSSMALSLWLHHHSTVIIWISRLRGEGEGTRHVYFYSKHIWLTFTSLHLLACHLHIGSFFDYSNFVCMPFSKWKMLVYLTSLLCVCYCKIRANFTFMCAFILKLVNSQLAHFVCVYYHQIGKHWSFI